METTIKIRGYEVTISDSDVVEAREFIPAGEYNPHNVRPFVAIDHGYVVGIAFASCEQDALDVLADEGRLDRFKVNEKDMGDYGDEEEGICRLGNAGEPFDIESMWLEAIPNPSFSFCALVKAQEESALASA